MPTAAVVSFRLGGTDGVSVEAAKWAGEFRALGFSVRTVAGSGDADVLVPGLAWGAPATVPELVEAVTPALEADVVVVENLLSLPLNPAAADAVAAVLQARPAILRHHDLPWQRDGGGAGPPDDAAWVHVTINEMSRAELAARGIVAICLHNRFPTEGWEGAREHTRGRHGLDGRVLLHPVRAIARKNVPVAVRLAEALGATYWLTGPAEEDYAGALAEVLAGADCRVVHAVAASAADAYAAADAVAFPSTWEGFGNPVVESALARRPLAISLYPVAVELAEFGFRWFPADEPAAIAAFLADPDPDLLDHNRAVAEAHFGIHRLAGELSALLERVLP